MILAGGGEVRIVENQGGRPKAASAMLPTMEEARALAGWLWLEGLRENKEGELRAGEYFISARGQHGFEVRWRR